MHKGLLFVVLLFSCFIARAQSPNMKFRHITSKDGLVQNNVVEILQDSKGFMWFGTRAGLNRFDGYNFRVYEYSSEEENSMSSNQISSMFEDSDGYIWIGYLGGGLDRYNPENDIFESFNQIPGSYQEIPSTNVAAIIEDSEKNIWIGTYASGLFKINKDRSRLLRMVHKPDDDSSLGYNSVRTILEDSKGNIWIGFWADRGIDRYDPEKGTFEHFRHDPDNPRSPAGNSIYDIYEDSSGNIWFATLGNGVSCYNPETKLFENFSHDPSNDNSLSSNMVRAIVEDDRGNIWFGTENGGLSIYNPAEKKFSTIVQDDIDSESINNNSIYSLYKDSYGNIWIGTYSGGVNVYFKNYNAFEHFRKKNLSNGLTHNSVTSFEQDPSGNIWIGTDGGGISILDLKSLDFRTFPFGSDNKRLVEDDYVMGITCDSDENMWFGTWGGGLMKYDLTSGEFTRFRYDPSDEGSINSNAISMVYEDHNHNIWVGTFGGGLNLYNKASGTFSHFMSNGDDEQTISNNFIVNIIEGDGRYLWIGTDGGGVNMLRPNGTFRRFIGVEGDGRGLRNGNILCSMKDHKGYLWFGTNRGLHRLNPDNLHFYYCSLGDSLTEYRVLGIEEDDHHNLWVSTNDGLFKFDPETKDYRRYSTSHGLQDIEFSRGASFKDKEGYLYFGGINGFNRFHPDSISVAVSYPPIEIVGFEVYNKPVEIGGKDSLLKKSITETEFIEIPWRYSMFSIDYAALNYNFSDDIEYAYMLENFDKHWYYVGKNRKATYTNLNPGEYVFKIKCKVDNEWGEEQQKLKIVILPPFWQTYWFRGFLVLIAVFIFVGFYLSRMRRIRRLNILVDRRTEEIRQQKEVLENQKEQLLEINSILEERQEKIGKQANELAQVIATKDKFLSIIAHDLRGPFTSIIGFSELLIANLKSFTTDEIEEHLRQIHRAAEQTYSLLEDLLLWANSQSGKLTTNLKTINMDEVSNEVFELLKEQARRKNIKIDFRSCGDAYVRADRFMLKTIVRNLLSNAIKFTSAGGQIIVKTERKQDMAMVTVSDNGVGISRELQEKLWDVSAHTSHTGTANETGSGLGLLLCKEFVEKQNGKIWVESTPGEGSDFKFTLPLSQK